MFKKIFKKETKTASTQCHAPSVEFINMNTRARTTNGTTALIWINHGFEVKTVRK